MDLQNQSLNIIIQKLVIVVVTIHVHYILVNTQILTAKSFNYQLKRSLNIFIFSCSINFSHKHLFTSDSIHILIFLC